MAQIPAVPLADCFRDFVAACYECILNREQCHNAMVVSESMSCQI